MIRFIMSWAHVYYHRSLKSIRKLNGSGFSGFRSASTFNSESRETSSMIVMKFGGTSVQEADAINNVVSIISSRESRAPIAVLSAMARVTDALLRVAQAANERRFEASFSI